MAESFPLDWPLGYKKTINRKRSAFREKTLDGVQNLLRAELSRLGAIKIIISSNLPLRRDGNIYAEYLSKKIDDPGIAAYFNYRGQNLVVCSDQYDYPWENMYALAKGIEAIRSMERWGVSEFMERAFTGFKALPETIIPQRSWHDVLGVPPNADEQTIKSAYRKLAQVHHPDTGGNAYMFDQITKAYQEGIKK